jgi:hypothetical protein
MPGPRSFHRPLLLVGGKGVARSGVWKDETSGVEPEVAPKIHRLHGALEPLHSSKGNARDAGGKFLTLGVCSTS